MLLNQPDSSRRHGLLIQSLDQSLYEPAHRYGVVALRRYASIIANFNRWHAGALLIKHTDTRTNSTRQLLVNHRNLAFWVSTGGRLTTIALHANRHRQR